MINEIKFRDEHPILRGLHLNFSKEDGTPYKTIIIAGENGCGKTTIFENLEVLMLGEIRTQDCFKFFDAIGYTAIHAGKIVNTTLKCNFHDNTRAVLQFADFPFPIPIQGISRMLEETRPAIYAKQMTEDDRDIRFYAFVYARARTGFPMGELTYIRTLRCDHGKRQGCYNSPYDTRKTEDYSLLKELLISVYNKQARYTEYCRTNKKRIDANNLVFARFKNAFNSFFSKGNTDLQFCKISDDGTDVLFTKNGKTLISINNLSSGEKQIVLRGTEVLQNKSNMRNGIVLVDEPELSMHPRWQKRVLKYYQDLLSADKVGKNGNLVKNEKGWIEKEQIAQLIVATHSPYIIEESLKDKEDTLVILLKEEDGKLNPKYLTDPDFIIKTPAEVNYIAFGIPSPEYVQQLYEIGKRDKKQSKWDEEIHQYISKNKNDSDKDRYLKESSFGNTKYHALPTYIRNSISHWDAERNYTDDNVRDSIDLLRESIEEEKGEEEHL